MANLSYSYKSVTKIQVFQNTSNDVQNAYWSLIVAWDKLGFIISPNIWENRPIFGDSLKFRILKENIPDRSGPNSRSQMQVQHMIHMGRHFLILSSATQRSWILSRELWHALYPKTLPLYLQTSVNVTCTYVLVTVWVFPVWYTSGKAQDSHCRGRPCQTCGEQNGTGTGFTACTSVFPCAILRMLHNYFHLLVLLPQGKTSATRELSRKQSCF